VNVRVIASRVGSAEPARAERSNARRSDPELVVDTLDGPFKRLKERLVARFERAYLERLMLLSEGNVSRAARTAQLDRMYLHRLLQRHAISRSGQDGEAPSGGAKV
jgi:DNA-binding NtrC family response regulator